MRGGRRKKKRKKFYVFVMIFAAAAVVLFFAETGAGEEKSMIHHLPDLGAKYLEAMDYESAAAIIENILKIDAKVPEEYADAIRRYFSEEQLKEMLGGAAPDDPQGQYNRLAELLEEVMKLLPEEFREEIRRQLKEKIK